MLEQSDSLTKKSLSKVARKFNFPGWDSQVDGATLHARQSHVVDPSGRLWQCLIAEHHDCQVSDFHAGLGTLIGFPLVTKLHLVTPWSSKLCFAGCGDAGGAREAV